ncbi:MAG: deoxyribose-phosphate aldolase [Bacteroidetes bacterium CG2_30_33_31]|nr:MAG: deoxyribose-phosphate aldolase [Bacteroidetes bacterium CG2_30_33_31]
MKIPSFQTIDEQFVRSELDKILAQNFASLNNGEALRLALSCIDLTTLEGSNNEFEIEKICRSARQFKNNGFDIPNVAAVCFYPPFTAQAKGLLKGTGINVAIVAGAFPSGQSPLSVRIAEVKYCVEQGADEIDMVISRGRYLANDFDFVFNEISEIKKVCGKTHLKVILETGEIPSLSAIKHVSEIAIAAGADFIKTSTGKIPKAATLEAFYVMLLAIKENYERTGEMVGIKPAGGIREAKDALNYLLVLEKVLGHKWMNNSYFRIGASSLANNVLAEIMNNN